MLLRIRTTALLPVSNQRFRPKERIMKHIVILSLLSALLAGCVVVPAGYSRGDGYYRHDYYHHGYYGGYRSGYGEHGQ